MKHEEDVRNHHLNNYQHKKNKRINKENNKPIYQENTSRLHTHIDEMLAPYFDALSLLVATNDKDAEKMNSLILERFSLMQNIMAQEINEHYLMHNGNANITWLKSYVSKHMLTLSQILSKESAEKLPLHTDDTLIKEWSGEFVKGAMAHAMVLQTLSRRKDSYTVFRHNATLDTLYQCDILVEQKRPHCFVAIDVQANAEQTLTELSPSTSMKKYIHHTYRRGETIPIKHLVVSPSMGSINDIAYHKDPDENLKAIYDRI